MSVADAYRSGKTPTQSGGFSPIVYLKWKRAIALNRDTGAEIWIYDAGTLVTRILLAHDSVFLGDAEGNVHCLDPDTGGLRGRIQTGGGLVSVLLDEGDRILVAAQGGVFALTPSGDLLWAYDSRKFDAALNAEVGLACTFGYAQQPDRM